MDACNERSAQRWWPRRGERGGGDQERLKLVEGARQLGIEEEERLLGAPEEREGCEAVDLSAHHLSAIYVCEAETSAATLESHAASSRQRSAISVPACIFCRVPFIYRALLAAPDPEPDDAAERTCATTRHG